MQWLLVRILAGRAIKERQCRLEGQAQYVNVCGSVTVWGSAHCSCNFFILINKTDQSETTKSYMLNTSLRLVNHK